MAVARRIEHNTLIFEISLTPEEITVFESLALNEMSRDLALSGFRKGNVPEDIARTHIGEERLFAKAVDKALRTHAGELLKNEEAEVVGEPHITITKIASGNPVEARLSIEILPKVDLGDWRNVRVEEKPVSVSEKEIDDAVDWLRKSRAKFRAVLRVAQLGDFVEINFETRISGTLVDGGTAKKHGFILGEGKFIPGFEMQISGMSSGEEKTFVLPFPSEWPAPELRGKEATFRVKLVTLQERLLPEVNDAFATDVGKFPSLSALRDSVRQGMMQEKRNKETRRIQAQAVEELSRRIPDDLPKTLLEAQVSRLEEEIRSAVASSGLTFDDYLGQLGATIEVFREGLKKPALDRAKSVLVLRAIVQSESLEASEEDITKEAQEFLRGFSDAKDTGHTLDPDAVRSYARTRVLNRMALALIEKVATQNL